MCKRCEEKYARTENRWCAECHSLALNKHCLCYIHMVRMMARKGSPKYQYIYSKLKFRLRRNDAGMYWLMRAAKNRNRDAQYRLFEILSEKEETKDSGYLWLFMAAHNGHEQANINIAWSLEETNPHVALEYYQAAAQVGSQLAKYWMAKFLINPKCPCADPDFAVQTFKQLLMAGDGNAACCLATYFDVPATSKLAVFYAKRALELEHPSALYLLGGIYAHNQKTRKAVKFLARASKHGDLEAMYSLAELFFAGSELCPDVLTAMQLLQKSADGKNARAQYRLGWHYLTGTHWPKDIVQARRYFTLAAKEGLAQTLNSIGVLYFHGIGVPLNRTEAVKWFENARKKDDKLAKCNLAMCTLFGDGLDADYDAAFRAFEELSGTAESWYGLALCYSLGRGTPQNLVEAFRYFQQAADYGSQDAMFELSKCYRFGWGTERDLTKAEYWTRQYYTIRNVKINPIVL